jgi:hypothetical protein
MKTLRILFTILSAVCLAALPLVGIFGGMDFVTIPLLGAGVFFLLMLFCKNKQEQQEEVKRPTVIADYLHPIEPKTEPTPDESKEISEETN